MLLLAVLAGCGSAGEPPPTAGGPVTHTDGPTQHVDDEIPATGSPVSDPGLEELPIDKVPGPEDVDLHFDAPTQVVVGRPTTVTVVNDHEDDAQVRIEFVENAGDFLSPEGLVDGGTITVPGSSLSYVELVVDSPGYVELLGTALPGSTYRFSVGLDAVTDTEAATN
ncbi:hypothetical protein [uncultured Ornithinimicrobium sp.]|uniref:hypothetical protein n=1 Tax=uncultured Ornithinimicrobium sp. TaxID=259307 RepID=UPI00259734A1|nr:hypothetical protein [uncultured Ornithinimicrobium sp.]